MKKISILACLMFGLVVGLIIISINRYLPMESRLKLSQEQRRNLQTINFESSIDEPQIIELDKFNMLLPIKINFAFFPETTRFDWLITNGVFITDTLSFAEDNLVNLTARNTYIKYIDIQLATDCQEISFIKEENTLEKFVNLDISEWENPKILTSFILKKETSPNFSINKHFLFTLNTANKNIFILREFDDNFSIKNETEFNISHNILWADWIAPYQLLIIFENEEKIIAQKFDLSTNSFIEMPINLSRISDKINFKSVTILNSFALSPNQKILAFNIHFDTGYNLHFSEVNPTPARIGIVSLETGEMKLLYRLPKAEDLFKDTTYYHQYSKYYDDNPIWVDENKLFFSRRFQTWDQPSNNEMPVLERQYCVYNFADDTSACTSFVGSIFHAYSKVRVCTP